MQQVFDANGKRKESSSGRVALSAPRLFRWEYVKPYPQLIVADGKKVWVYDPDLEQVTVRAQGVEEQNSPLAALIDPSRLDRDFTVEEGGQADGLEWLVLKPKQADNASFETARLGFDATGLARMEVVDALGQRTEIAFSTEDAPTSTRPFTSAAEGVDVVGDADRALHPHSSPFNVSESLETDANAAHAGGRKNADGYTDRVPFSKRGGVCGERACDLRGKWGMRIAAGDGFDAGLAAGRPVSDLLQGAHGPGDARRRPRTDHRRRRPR